MMRQRYLAILGGICCLLSIISCSSFKEVSVATPSLHMYQFGQLDNLMKNQPKPVAVFLHAPWCGYCRNMEQNSFTNPAVIRLLNEEYYFVSFDGESKASVTFRGKTFAYQPTGRNTGTHDLAFTLGNIEGELTYPAFIILNPPSYDIIFQHQAFLSAEVLSSLLAKAIE